MKVMRQPTLETLGLGSVLEIFKNGKLPLDAERAVEQVFGPKNDRGSLVISGANGIVGAGKTMQLGARLQPFGVRVVGLDFPNAPDGIGGQYPGLERAFGRDGAAAIMSNIIRMNYDGKNLPSELGNFKPRFLLEAIPEILEIKKAHYEVFQKAFPGIEIRSVTSGFPASELGVGVAHPAFPHQINKMYETVEDKPSAVTQMLWALGLIPVPVSDNWSFVLDVLFCGLTLAGLRLHRATNMPFWKIDKFIRKYFGPNPFRAHDAIGAAGANFLTWSCLHHLSGTYGELFTPTPELDERKVTGENWYPLNHFRPLVDWKMDDNEVETFHTWVMGPIIQMTSLMLHEKRGHLTHINQIGEICAQFRSGVITSIRKLGAEAAIKRVETYHALHPEAAGASWHPEAFDKMSEPQWQQVYVNAEHDGQVGLITIARESYNSEVDAEMNRAIDWLKTEKIDRVIVTGDFHLSTQMVGADTSEFYPALSDSAVGLAIAQTWSATARRLNDEFQVSVGYLAGKRALGGMLELLEHCHYIVSHDGGEFGMPEVTLPVVPGMEGCHWPFRKTEAKHYVKLLQLLLTGRSVKAAEAVGWLIDFAGSVDKALATAWAIVSDGSHSIKKRELQTGSISVGPETGLSDSGDPAVEAARKAILSCVIDSCSASMSEAITVQAKHSADFMVSRACQRGMIGSEAAKVMNV